MPSRHSTPRRKHTRKIRPPVDNHICKSKTRRRHGCLLGGRCHGKTTGRHGYLVGSRGHGEKRCKTWLCEKRCKRWWERRQRAFYKEGTALPLCLTRITIRTRRTHTHDDGLLPSGLRLIDTLSCSPGSKLMFTFEHSYLYIASLHASAHHCAFDFFGSLPTHRVLHARLATELSGGLLPAGECIPNTACTRSQLTRYVSRGNSSQSARPPILSPVFGKLE